jgi:hypothetical protein
MLNQDEETALSVFQVVLDGSTEMDVHRRRADCMSRMGDIYLRRGELDRAKQLWDTARPLFVRSSRAKDPTSIGSKLAQLARNGIETSVRNFGAEISAKDSDISSKLSQLNLTAPTSQPTLKSPGTEAVAPAAMENKEIVAGYSL